MDRLDRLDRRERLDMPRETEAGSWAIAGGSIAPDCIKLQQVGVKEKAMQDSVSTVSVRGTTRRGKIARLPKAIREQLNRALEDGKDGKGFAICDLGFAISDLGRNAASPRLPPSCYALPPSPGRYGGTRWRGKT